jgi:hypothetical protein
MTGLFALPDAIFDFFKVNTFLFSLKIFFLDMLNAILNVASGFMVSSI